MLRPVQPALLTLYADLAQQVRWSIRGGTVYQRSIGGARYFYAKTAVGADRRDSFIGRTDDPEAIAKAESMRTAAAQARERRKTVRMLRDRGFHSPDAWLGRIIDAVSDAGLFDRGVVIVGTAAYQMMEPLVGHYLPGSNLMTSDIDLVIADLAISAETGESFETILHRADPSFIGIPSLDLRKPYSRWRTGGIGVDLLTPVLRRTDESPMPLAELEAGAAPLQYLGWLIAQPVSTIALWASGIDVRVPQPARYAVHKLILAQKRNTTSMEKRSKDLDQARTLIEVLGNSDPFALEDALEDARAQGAEGWARPIARSLAELGLDL
jgi:hypothetical protein